MCSLHFLSTNTNKYNEIHPILHKYKIAVKFLNLKLREIQGESLSQIAAEKSKDAFKLISKPVIVEDDGLVIHELNGFPGSYSSFVFKTILSQFLCIMTAICSDVFLVKPRERSLQRLPVQAGVTIRFSSHLDLN